MGRRLAARLRTPTVIICDRWYQSLARLNGRAMTVRTNKAQEYKLLRLKVKINTTKKHIATQIIFNSSNVVLSPNHWIVR